MDLANITETLNESLMELIGQMEHTSLVLAGTVIALGSAAVWTSRNKATLPPGPSRLPLLGSLNMIGADERKIHMLMKRLAETYGDIMTIHFGSKPTILLNSHKLVREAFVTKGREFGGRGDQPRLQAINPRSPHGHAILLGDMSDEWKTQRNTALGIMRNLGWGKNIQSRIQDEAQILVSKLRQNNGQPMDFAKVVPVTISNVICSLLFGKRFDHDDAEFCELLSNVDAITTGMATDRDADALPFLRLLRPNYQQNWETMKKSGQDLLQFYHQRIQEGKSKLLAGEEPSDFVTMYLTELGKMENGSARIREDWLEQIISDFFLAGSETTTTTLKWAMMFMAKYPHVQEKVHQEMNRVIGSDEYSFKLSDRERLAYTEATLMEVARMGSIVPLGVPHKTTTNVELAGYTIPKGTEVWSNQYFMLHDPQVWDAPDQFKPERFLNQDGSLMKSENWIPFSMGRRTCLGEQLARQELFLIFSHILHSFTISFPPGQPEPSQEGEFHFVLKPEPYHVCFQPRCST